MIRRIILIMLTLALAAGISACGKKSDLEPPPHGSMAHSFICILCR